MSKLLEQFNAQQLKQVPDVQPGDTVKVHQKVKEGNKERIQTFAGVVIAVKHGKGVSAMMTVRKVVDGVGVERIFPLHATFIDKIEIVRRGKVRRAKLYYLREAKGKKSRLKNKEFVEAIAVEPVIDGSVSEAASEAPVEAVADERPAEAPQN